VNNITPVQNTSLIRYADFMRLTTPDAVYRFSTAPYVITVSQIDANPFTALGQLIAVNSAQRDIKSTANETTVTLVGIDTAMLGLVLGSKIKGSQIEIWHGFFDADNQLITTGSPTTGGLYKYFNGYINSFSISEQWMEELRMFVGVISVSASSTQIILQNRTAGRYTNDNRVDATAKVQTLRAIAYAGRPTPRGFTVINGGARVLSVETNSQINEATALGELSIDEESLLMLLVA
jgi:hypothetical protein